MTSEDATVAVIDALDALAVPYMVVGSLANNVYGVPRSSQDADFVVQLGAVSMMQVAQRLGPAFRLDPQKSETVTATTRYSLQLRGSPFSVELFVLSADPHDQARFARRVRLGILGRDVFLPTAEDVVITKLRWWLHARRTKDFDDVRNVVAVQGDRLDWNYVHGWCDAQGTRLPLEQVRRSIPPI